MQQTQHTHTHTHTEGERQIEHDLSSVWSLKTTNSYKQSRVAVARE